MQNRRASAEPIENEESFHESEKAEENEEKEEVEAD